jgi:hypothetical protein
LPLSRDILPAIAASTKVSSQVAPKAKGYVGNEACQRYAEIYRSYSRTAMARASGPAERELIPGELQHRSSGVHYCVYSENGSAWLRFESPGDPEVRGTRRLLSLLGSGRRGRTYLFEPGRSVIGINLAELYCG